jgi:hypothetical protein
LTTQTPFPKAHPSHYVIVFGIWLAGVGGSFMPWLWRDAVALQLTAPGLAEFVKFLPEVRTVQLFVTRLDFLQPLFWAMIALPLIVENQALRLPIFWRWLLRASVMPLALASLSPVWTPTTLTNEEFRLQTMLAVVAMGLTVFAPLFKRLPLWLLVIAITLGGIRAIVLAGLQFSLIQTSLANVYAEPVSLGLGWWLTMAGVSLSIIGGGWAVWRAPQSPSPPSPLPKGEG